MTVMVTAAKTLVRDWYYGVAEPRIRNLYFSSISDQSSAVEALD